LIDGMLDGPVPCDLVQALALPAPSLIICRLLGVPHEDRDFFPRNAGTFIDRNSSIVEAMTARQTLTEYLDQLITIKQTRPGDDVMTRLGHHIEDVSYHRKQRPPQPASC
jgi:cytochrome P450